ncbi:beta/alpha barrel domain-containing protein [Liquorilactobacillus mali]|uniref:hydrolase n=1 Tax=Liquorilactobacillus mali TaxID=1618 RepID=UPI0029546B29|nr:hydrolase [Liquorilactobacillus mali]MDV7757230.1 hydrolase [Liquorilactobacillus mali]
MNNSSENIPNLSSKLRADIVETPAIIQQASGLKLFGKKIKSIIYTTDVAVIANCNADAVLVVYPWTPNTRILEAVSTVSNISILAGIGGGLTNGIKSTVVGLFAEENGAQAVVLNAPTPVETIRNVKKAVDVPIIYTVVSSNLDIKERIDAGVKAFNIAGGKDTPKLVAWVRNELKRLRLDENFPIIASGGKTDEQILKTIHAGANAVSFTAYGITEATFQRKMEKYRREN